MSDTVPVPEAALARIDAMMAGHQQARQQLAQQQAQEADVRLSDIAATLNVVGQLVYDPEQRAFIRKPEAEDAPANRAARRRNAA